MLSAAPERPTFAQIVEIQLRLDASDRPRIAFYSSADGVAVDRVVYASCNANCGVETSWTAQPIAPIAAGNGNRGLDLALDAQGRSRVSFDQYDEPSGLGYALCDSGCDQAGATWSAMLAESSISLDAAYPIPVAGTCSGSLWFAGRWSRIAIAPSGHAIVVYGAEHQQGGTCNISTDKMLVRAAML